MSFNVESTIDVDRAGDITWDALVVGAGPAGAFASQQIAASGASVLLVDKSPFPRYKVCGCCLNMSALRVLRRANLDQLELLSSAPTLNELCLAAGGTEFRIGIPPGLAVAREDFDAALVAAAKGTGAAFLSGIHATIGNVKTGVRSIKLNSASKEIAVSARMVLAADGLAGRSLCDIDEFAVSSSPRSRIGAGVIATAYPIGYEMGKIYMACAGGNYVGLVRLADKQLDVAAAFLPDFCKDKGGPGAAAQHVLREAGLPAIERLESLTWRGTPALTRRRGRIAGERLFVIGDAALYVEPFTGEGMAWALRSAEAVTPLVLSGISHWKPSLSAEWNREHSRMIGHHGRLAAILGELLRHPGILSGMAHLVEKAPLLADPVLKYITAL